MGEADVELVFPKIASKQLPQSRIVVNNENFFRARRHPSMIAVGWSKNVLTDFYMIPAGSPPVHA